MTTSEVKENMSSVNDEHPQKKKNQTVRVQLDFSPEAIQRLEEIGEMAGTSTRSETIRNAIRLYAWFIEETKRNTIIQFCEDGQIITSFKASLLHDGIKAK